MLGQLIAAEQIVLLSDSDGTVDSLGCKVSLKRHTSVKGLMLKIPLYMSKGLITSYMLRTLAGMLVPWKMQKGCIRLVWHGRCETCKLLSSTLHVAGLPRALFGSWLRNQEQSYCKLASLASRESLSCAAKRCPQILAAGLAQLTRTPPQSVNTPPCTFAPARA